MGISIKKITRGGKRLAGKAVKGVSKTASGIGRGAERGIKDLGKKAERSARDALKINEQVATTVVTGGANLAVAALPEMPDIPDPVAPAAPAPDPEIGTQQLGADENISRRKKRSRRKGLRIDLNTGGAPSGNGVNIPVG